MGSIEDKVARLLADLPESPDDIAAFLLVQGCLGVVGNSKECPVAQYLTNNGIERPVVAAGLPSGSVCAHIPKNVTRFIHRFDDRKYPLLIQEEEE